MKFNKKKFDKLNFSEKKINIFLKKRLEGKIEVNYTGIIDLMNANKSKKLFNRNYRNGIKELKKDKKKKIGLIKRLKGLFE